MNRKASTWSGCSSFTSATFPDGRERQAWPGLTYVRVTPTWLRYSDYSVDPPEIVEFDVADLR